MTAIAIIGGDGSGKSTVCDMLEGRHEAPIVTVYMGMNPDSSRISLPTTRLVHMFKVRKLKSTAGSTSPKEHEPTSLHSLEHRKVKRGRMWSALRLGNRIAEESVRQMVSWWHQGRGRVVVYDRHFSFDYTPKSGKSDDIFTRIHLWFLHNVYPEPDLVILLDAPPEVIHARTEETSVKYLADRREVFLRLGATMRKFFVVDVDRPIDDVYEDVADIVTNHLRDKHRRTVRTPSTKESA